MSWNILNPTWNTSEKKTKPPPQSTQTRRPFPALFELFFPNLSFTWSQLLAQNTSWGLFLLKANLPCKTSICAILIVVYYNPLDSWVVFHVFHPLYKPSVWSDLLSPESRRCDEDLWHRHPEPLEASESFQRSGTKITSFFRTPFPKVG